MSLFCFVSIALKDPFRLRFIAKVEHFSCCLYLCFFTLAGYELGPWTSATCDDLTHLRVRWYSDSFKWPSDCDYRHYSLK